ncbi:MAG: BolA family transcriptional regulator [Parasphingorhabdus sp.]
MVVRNIAGSNYISSMQTESKGPVALEIEKRLMTTLSPSNLNVINDSAKHHGHAGDDGSGESHFTVEIECAEFVGQSRLNRQRLVNKALGDLMREKVHAMAIKAKAPGE